MTVLRRSHAVTGVFMRGVRCSHTLHAGRSLLATGITFPDLTYLSTDGCMRVTVHDGDLLTCERLSTPSGNPNTGLQMSIADKLPAGTWRMRVCNTSPTRRVYIYPTPSSNTRIVFGDTGVAEFTNTDPMTVRMDVFQKEVADMTFGLHLERIEREREREREKVS